MKYNLKLLLLAAAFMLSAAPTLADGSHTGKVYLDTNGNREVIDNGGTLKLNSGAAVDSSGMAFATGLTANPMVQSHFQNMTTAQLNAGVTVLASTASRTVYPDNFMLMASGTAAGATSVVVYCTDAATVIASVAAAKLVTYTPLIALNSAANTDRSVLASGALVTGCAAGQGIMVSTIGTLTGTNNLFIKMLYTVQ